MPAATTNVNLDGPAAFRALARAFAHLGDFDRLVQGLQAALDRSRHFERMQISVDRELADGAAHFSPGALTLPLAANDARFGTLQISPGGEHRQFGAEDLHLMAALADFLSVVLGQSLRIEDAVRSQALLKFLLNQAPIGLAAYTPDRRLLVANDLAAQWLGQAGPPFIEIEAGPGNFYLRTAGKLVYGEARRAPDGVWVVALHDLTPAQIRLMEGLQREVYRGLVEKRPVTLLLVESPGVQHGVMRRLPALREVLAAGEQTGPYDAHRVGIVLPGAGAVRGRHRLREWAELWEGIEGLKVSWAELGRDGSAPEALLEAALRRAGPLPEAVKPAVLVQEGDPGVADAMALVLRRDCRVVRSPGPARTRELLQREEFDLLVTEFEPRGSPAGPQLVAEARELQPGLRALFTCVKPPPYNLPAEFLAEGVPVVQKPFLPDQLRQAVRNRLAS